MAALPQTASLPLNLELTGGARDLLALTKPRVTGLVLCTTATGLFLAPGHLGPVRICLTLLGTAMTVGAANALNCYLERESDGRMLRTRNRPLPAGRIQPGSGLLLGLSLAITALPILALTINPLTAFLGLLALVSYVWVYTPLKKITPKALLVGSVPGAIPPLMGWTAATGHLDAPGLWLFGLMFVWQLPHFLAITLYLQEDYARGGLKVLPLVRGERAARLHLVLYTVLLVPMSLLAVPMGLAGKAYLATACALGLGFLLYALRGLRPQLERVANLRWARGLFLYSIVYLTILFAVLLLDAVR